jgi:hypothetical protein
MKALRQTVDLSAYPDLVVVYLGMTVNVLTGVKTLLGFGPKIEDSVAARPDGLLLHENIFYSLFPVHLGMRQYWRDFDSLERFTRTDPHREWWKQFLRDTGGTGFWHELYSARVVLKRCTSMSSDLLAFSVLPRWYLQKEAYFRLASDYTGTEWRTHPRRIRKQICRSKHGPLQPSPPLVMQSHSRHSTVGDRDSGGMFFGDFAGNLVAGSGNLLRSRSRKVPDRVNLSPKRVLGTGSASRIL